MPADQWGDVDTNGDLVDELRRRIPRAARLAAAICAVNATIAAEQLANLLSDNALGRLP